MTALLNPRVWIALALAAALALAGLFLYRAGKATVRADFEAWKTVAAESRALADRAQRTEEQRREDSTRKVIDEARTETLAAQADAVRTGAAADRLSGQLAAYVARARAAGANPAVAGGGQSQLGADPLDLLAQLYSRSDKAAADIGKYADALRIAGGACERYADRLKFTSEK